MSRRRSVFALAIAAPTVLTIALAGALSLSTTAPVPGRTVQNLAPVAQDGVPSGSAATPDGDDGPTTNPTPWANDDNYSMASPPAP